MTDETLERIILPLRDPVTKKLCRFFDKNGWDVWVLGPDHAEAMMSSGYGSGPAIVDLGALAAFISEEAK